MAERLAGRYRLEEVLGHGSYATVYAAVDEELEVPVAIKLLHSHLDNRGKARIFREAEIALALNHPNIITHYGASADGEHHFLILERSHGQPLSQLLNAGPLPFDKVRAILVALASALCYAHEKGVLHRDLTPANILITEDDEVKLIDFGIAKFDTDGEATQTRDIGTAAYAAPEQLAGKPSTKSDIYGLGAVAFHMLVGIAPPLGRSVRGQFPSHVPTDLNDLSARCLDLDPERRPTARDILEQLLLAPEPVTVGRRLLQRCLIGFIGASVLTLVTLAASSNGFQLFAYYLAGKLERQGVIRWQRSAIVFQMVRAAALYDDAEVLRSLIDRRPSDMRKPLVEAAVPEAINARAVHAAAFLFDAGVPLTDNVRNDDLLVRILQSGSGELLRLLLDHGFDIDAALAADDLFTPTLAHPTLDQFRLLVNHVANRTTSRPLRTVPLQAAFILQSPVARDLVIQAGPKALNATDLAGSTALLNFAALGRYDYFRAILKIEGIDPNIGNVDGITPLLSLIERLRTPVPQREEVLAIISLLLQSGALPRRVSGDTMTPLMMAACTQDPEVVALLLADPRIGPIDEVESHGFTALRFAVDPGPPFNPEVVRMLLAAGASPDTVGVDGKSVRDIAQIRGHAQFLPPAERIHG